MGVRPPTGGDQERGAIEFGIAALIPVVEEADLAFPVEREHLVNSLDDPEIPLDARGRSIALSTLLEETGQRQFESERELRNAVHPVFETHRVRTPTGWLATIRSSLPL